MRVFMCILIFLLQPLDVKAKNPEPVSMGDGTFLLTDKNVTIFGSPTNIVVKLMRIAHAYCKNITGFEARLLDSDQTDSAPGYSGQFGNQPGVGASASIQFVCNTNTPGQSLPVIMSNENPSLPKNYSDRVDSIKKKVLSGDFAVVKAEIVQEQKNAKLLSSDISNILEKNNTWWLEEGKLYIFLNNTTSSSVSAFSFIFSEGLCNNQHVGNSKEFYSVLKNPLNPNQASVILISSPVKINGTSCLSIAKAWSDT